MVHVAFEGEATYIEKHQYLNKVWWVKIKEFGLDMCLTLRSLISRIVFLVLIRKCPF
jgi:hypothetical protein